MCGCTGKLGKCPTGKCPTFEEMYGTVCAKCGAWDGKRCEKHPGRAEGTDPNKWGCDDWDERECRWCGWEYNDGEPTCDCTERMDCEKAGQPGHTSCGKLPCGCPRYSGRCTGLCKRDPRLYAGTLKPPRGRHNPAANISEETAAILYSDDEDIYDW